jgi:phage terminase large subunit GpA-like protein
LIPWSSNESVQVLRRRLYDCFTPPVRLTCSKWTIQRRKHSAGASSKGGGHFSFENAPWQEEVLDAPDEPDVISVVLMWASQVTGKTETINNRIGFTIDIKPGQMLMLQPTLEMGEAWAKDRLAPMLRDTPCLRGKVKDPRSRDSGNTILHKRFPGGAITVCGANSPASLAMRPIRDLYCDEEDRYPDSAGTEGDPVALAEARTESYPDAVSFKTSTPTIEGRSKIKKEFDRSDKRYWFVKCPACPHEQHLTWAHVKWTWQKPDGTEDSDPARACIACSKCAAEWTEEQRQMAIRAGHWKATAPFKGVRGYHINALYCLFRPQKGFKTRTHQVVSKFLKANEAGKEALMVFTNTVLAETWVEAAEVPTDWQELYNRREPYTIPAKCFLLICKIDVQANRLEGEIEGFGFGDESWGIEHFKLFGSPFKPEVWKALDEKLAQTYDHPSGQKIRVAITGIDMGGHADKKSWAVAVYRYVKSRTQASRGQGGVIALKGSSARGAQLVKESLQRNGVNLLLVGTDAAKSAVYERLKIQEPGPRYYHFPESYGVDYFKGLLAEEIRLVKRRGYMMREWHKTFARNEPLDLKGYGIALLELLNPDMRAIAARYKMPEGREYVLKPATQFNPDKPESAPVVQAKQAQAVRRKRLPFRRRGF